MSARKCQRIRRPVLALALVLAAALQPVPAQPGPASATRVGYVDMKRLLDNAPQVLAGRQRLQREFAARDAALRADETRLATLKARQERDGATLSQTDADQLRREIDALDRGLRRTREELRADLKTRSDQELDRSWQEINNAVAEYSREQGYELVVPSPVVYASARIDITDAVLERLKRDYRAAHPVSP